MHLEWLGDNQPTIFADCRYRFSRQPISTYMSLTLARLCGEWQLVSRNHDLVSRNYEARGVIGGKYEAQIVIFRILAAVNRFFCISWKVESRWGKSESCWRKQKAIEGSRKPLKKSESRWRGFSQISQKLESHWRKTNFVWGKMEFRRRKIPIFPRYSLGSGNFGVLFLTPDLLPYVCAWIYLIGFNYS